MRLGGLWVEPGPKVPPELAGNVIPWERLTRLRHVRDESGALIRIGRRRLVLTVRNDIERHAADRARSRNMRRRWQCGAIELTEEFELTSSGGALAAAALLVYCVLPCGVILATSRRFIVDLAPLGSAHQTAAALTMCFLAALAAWALGIAVLITIRILRSARLKSCTVTADEIRVVLRDGRSARARWADVRLVPGVSGPAVLLPEGLRIQLPPRIFRGLRYRPSGLTSRDEPSPRGRLITVVLLALATVGATVSALFAADAPTYRLLLALSAPFVLAAYVTSIAVLARWVPRRVARWKRQRRRSRVTVQAA